MDTFPARQDETNGWLHPEQLLTRAVPEDRVVRSLIIALLLAVAWTVSLVAGGASSVGVHAFYAPILFAACWFGHGGGALTALVASFLAGPLLPIESGGAFPDDGVHWVSRALFFQSIGQLAAWLVAHRRGVESALQRSRQMVSALNARLAEDQIRELGREFSSDRIRSMVTAPERIRVVFQPLVHLPTGRTIGVEGLARFDVDPGRAPDEWFGEAWVVGLGKDLELAALRRAASFFDGLSEDVMMSVNLSPETLVSEDLDAMLPTLPVHRMIFELTEHARVDDYALIRTVAERIRELGGQVAIDDAGAGYSSFRHILELRPDIIKLDVRLIRRIESDTARQSLTQSFCRLADELGAKVVAEGIESEDEVEALVAVGVQYGQGFLLGRPQEPRTLDLSVVEAPAVEISPTDLAS